MDDSYVGSSSAEELPDEPDDEETELDVEEAELLQLPELLELRKIPGRTVELLPDEEGVIPLPQTDVEELLPVRFAGSLFPDAAAGALLDDRVLLPEAVVSSLSISSISIFASSAPTAIFYLMGA